MRSHRLLHKLQTARGSKCHPVVSVHRQVLECTQDIVFDIEVRRVRPHSLLHKLQARPVCQRRPPSFRERSSHLDIEVRRARSHRLLHKLQTAQDSKRHRVVSVHRQVLEGTLAISWISSSDRCVRIGCRMSSMLAEAANATTLLAFTANFQRASKP